MGPGGGGGRSELDRLLDGWIDEINEAIERGNMSNCQGAIKLFQRALAQPNSTQAITALADKINPGSSSYYSAVTSSTNGGGWKPQYKDDFRANGVASQAHHFAGFFAQGYTQAYGSDGGLAVVASLLREVSDMRTNPGGRFNWGDFNLGVAGGTLGALAGSGSPLFTSNDLEKVLCGPQ